MRGVNAGGARVIRQATFTLLLAYTAGQFLTETPPALAKGQTETTAVELDSACSSLNGPFCPQLNGKAMPQQFTGGTAGNQDYSMANVMKTISKVLKSLQIQRVEGPCNDHQSALVCSFCFE